MKKALFLALSLSISALSAQNTTLTFTAKTTDDTYIALDSVKVTNTTQNWSQMLVFPDTAITIEGKNGVESFENKHFLLLQNVPNPFSKTTNVELQLPENETVEMVLYDLTGKVCLAEEKQLEAGVYCLEMSVGTAQTYLLQVTTSKGSQTLKMLCLDGGGEFGLKIAKTGKNVANLHKLTTQNLCNAGDRFIYVGYVTAEYGTVVTETMPDIKGYTDEKITFMMNILIETVLTFVAQTTDNQHIALDSVKIINTTKDWTVTLLSPDTILVLQRENEIGIVAKKQKLNIANPFAAGDNLTYVGYSKFSGGIVMNSISSTKDANHETITFTMDTSFVDYTETVNGVSFDMIAVEAGTFLMGAQKQNPLDTHYDENAYTNEAPVHEVTLTKNYYIGKFEVTQALWNAVMCDSNDYHPGWEDWRGLGDNYPAYLVSRNDIELFIHKLDSLTGKQYRLLTEAEWEFAARGGTQQQNYKYSGSDTLDKVGWYWDNIQPGYGTQIVGQKQPNVLGIYDMSGNVAEWCQDWLNTYPSDPQTDPVGTIVGTWRVPRGGYWGTGAINCRITVRGNNYPNDRYATIGFRLACTSTVEN